jgi:hypothetical protein
MNIFTKAKIYGEAYLAQKSGLLLNKWIEARAKTLQQHAPQGEAPFHIAVQPDGTTQRTEFDQGDKTISDERTLREKMGNIYADSRQRQATQTIEDISRHEIAIRDDIESQRESRARYDELLKISTEYHYAKGNAHKNLFMFVAIALFEILAQFIPFGDLFGIDVSKVSSELNYLILFFTALGLSIGFFVVSLLIAKQVLYAKTRIFWIVCLSFIALIVGKIRTMYSATLQETEINSIIMTLLYIIIGIGFPLAGAVIYRKWKEASQYVRRTDSMLRRLTEQEERYTGRLQEATQERQGSQNQLNQLINEYVTNYQQAIEEKERLRADWEKHARYVEAYLAEMRLAFLFWQGWRSKRMMIPQPVKRVLKITALLWLSFVLVLSSYTYAKADGISFNLLAVCDRSSSADEFSCTPETIEHAARLWLRKADDAGGGTFELFIIDKGFDSTTILFSATYPERFPGPVTANKKKWRMAIFQRLYQATKTLPTNKGSAIIEAIYRSSLRIPHDGQTLVLVMSDMREVNEAFNFERHVPSEREFMRWLDRSAIKPVFKSSTTIIVCGAHPYTPDQTTRMTIENYDRQLKLWRSVFTQWGVKATISEACSLNNQE